MRGVRNYDPAVVGFVGVKRAETLKGEVFSFIAVQQSGRKDIPVHAKKGSTEERRPSYRQET